MNGKRIKNWKRIKITEFENAFKIVQLCYVLCCVQLLGKQFIALPHFQIEFNRRLFLLKFLFTYDYYIILTDNI